MIPVARRNLVVRRWILSLLFPPLAGALGLVAGCDSEALWGDGPGATAME